MRGTDTKDVWEAFDRRWQMGFSRRFSTH